jgi:hypothetical protein
MKHKLAVLFFMLLWTVGPLYAQMQEKDVTIEAEGYGLNKADALLKAKRAAVEKGIGTVLISETEVKNFELQKDLIITKTSGAVKRYDVLKQELQPDKVYYIRIRAVVSLDSITKDLAALKILLESMDKPRMMVVFEEENGNVAENTVLDFLSKKEFELADPAAVAALMQKDDALITRAAAGDAAAAAQLGAATGAEYVIVGRVTKDLMKNNLLAGSGMKSGQANITAKVINCSTGKIIAAKSANGAAVHVAEEIAKATATRKAAEKLMDRALFESIVASFQDMLNNGMSLDVVVKNVTNFKMQKAVRKELQGISEVVSVSKRKFGGGRLSLTVLYKGSPDAFAESVDGKKLSGKTMAVTDMAGSKVVIVME